MLNEYKKKFISFLMDNNALQFGEFTLKSGRNSPYFFNSARFNTGDTVSELGHFFARQILDSGISHCDIVFGPAYKGIPLALATSQRLSELTNTAVGWLFDRKEAKTHGEFSENKCDIKAKFVGKIPEEGSHIVMVDDVLTTGATKYEAVEQVRSLCPGAIIEALVISVNRQERDSDHKDPVETFEKLTGIKVISIVDFLDIMTYIEETKLLSEELMHKVKRYKNQWTV